jgi:hypothetical protein
MPIGRLLFSASLKIPEADHVTFISLPRRNKKLSKKLDAEVVGNQCMSISQGS